MSERLRVLEDWRDDHRDTHAKMQATFDHMVRHLTVIEQRGQAINRALSRIGWLVVGAVATGAVDVLINWMTRR